MFGQVARHPGAACPRCGARAGGSCSSRRSADGSRSPFTAPYAASKHALEAIGDCTARGAAQLGRAGGADRDGLGRDPDLGQGPGGSRAGEHPAGARGGVRADAGEGWRRRCSTPPAAASRPSSWPRRSSARSPSARMKARYVVGRRAKGMLLAKRLLPDPHVRSRDPAVAHRLSAVRTAAGTRPSRRTGWWWPPASAASPGRAYCGRERFAVPGEQIQTLTVGARAVCALRALSAASAYSVGVVVEGVQGEHPLQVDRVVLRGEVEQVAEPVKRGAVSGAGAFAVAGVCGQPAQHGLRVDQRSPRCSRSAWGRGCCPHTGGRR